MRTTLDIDADILGVAKELAFQRKTSAGKVISELAREALAPKRGLKTKNGFPVLEPIPGAPPMTLEMVNRLRDEE
ncbi:MAG: CopG family transcriptional regulator [Bryobacteraceae bacterium]